MSVTSEISNAAGAINKLSKALKEALRQYYVAFAALDNLKDQLDEIERQAGDAESSINAAEKAYDKEESERER